MGFKNIGIKTIEKLYHGGLRYVWDILDVDLSSLSKLGFGQGESLVIYNSIQNKILDGMDLEMVLAYCSVFGEGIGYKKIKKMIHKYPDIMSTYESMSKDELEDMLDNIPGFGKKTITSISNNIENASLLLHNMSKYLTVNTFINTKDKLSGLTVIISGKSDKLSRVELKRLIKSNGGSYSNRVLYPRDNVKQILINIGSTNTKKVINAKKYNIRFYNEKQFLKILE